MLHSGLRQAPLLPRTGLWQAHGAPSQSLSVAHSGHVTLSGFFYSLLHGSCRELELVSLPPCPLPLLLFCWRPLTLAGNLEHTSRNLNEAWGTHPGAPVSILSLSGISHQALAVQPGLRTAMKPRCIARSTYFSPSPSPSPRLPLPTRKHCLCLSLPSLSKQDLPTFPPLSHKDRMTTEEGDVCGSSESAKKLSAAYF